MANAKKTITYYRLGGLDNGAVISQPYCNLENKFHLQVEENDQTIGILVQVKLKSTMQWTTEIIFVYKNQRCWRHQKYTRKYNEFVKNSIQNALDKKYIMLTITDYEEEK